MALSKSDLAKALRQPSGLSYTAAAACIDTLLESITNALTLGERIELRGFGSFEVRKRLARKAGVNGSVPEHGRVVFRPFEKLRRSVWHYKDSDHGHRENQIPD